MSNNNTQTQAIKGKINKWDYVKLLNCKGKYQQSEEVANRMRKNTSDCATDRQ